MPKLKNPRHEAFCQEYQIDRNASQSYKRVYGCKIKVAETNGVRLLQNAQVKQRLSELQDRHIKKSEITVDWIEQKTKEIAEQGEQDSARLKALEMLGRARAMYTDKQKIEGDISIHKSIVDQIEEED